MSAERWCRRFRRVLVVALAMTFAATARPAQASKFATVKANFDVGTLKLDDGRDVDLWYEDVHFKFRTLAEVWDEPVTYDVGGLGEGTATVTPPTDDDRFTHISFDWSRKDEPVKGKDHFGGNFLADIDIGNKGYRAEYFLESIKLTNVACTDPSLNFYVNELKVQSPVDWEVEPDKSINWTFEINNPDITGPVMFTNVRFYKTSVEPALVDLTAANFASLPTTLMHTEPDFALVYGETRAVHVEGISYPDWVIVYYETDWVPPDLMAFNGGRPVTMHVDQWIATNVLEVPVPEPGGLTLLVLAVGLSRRTYRACRRSRA